MNYVTLKAEIESGPLAETLAPLVAAGDHSAVAAALNVRTERGPVPIREISAYCVTRGITGAVLAADSIPIGADLAPGVPMTLAVKGLLKTIVTLIQDDYRLETADLDDAATGPLLDGLEAVGVIDGPSRAGLLALADGRRGRAEVAVGRPVTPDDVGRALNQPEA